MVWTSSLVIPKLRTITRSVWNINSSHLFKLTPSIYSLHGTTTYPRLSHSQTMQNSLPYQYKHFPMQAGGELKLHMARRSLIRIVIHNSNSVEVKVSILDNFSNYCRGNDQNAFKEFIQSSRLLMDSFKLHSHVDSRRNRIVLEAASLDQVTNILSPKLLLLEKVALEQGVEKGVDVIRDSFENGKIRDLDIVKDSFGNLKTVKYTGSEPMLLFQLSIPEYLDVQIDQKSGMIELCGNHKGQVVRILGAESDIRVNGIQTDVLEIETGGDIKASFVQAKVATFRSFAGNIQTRTIQGRDISMICPKGSIDAGSVYTEESCFRAGGDIKVGSCSGKAWMRSTGGSLYLPGLGGSIEAETIDGDIRVQVPDSTADVFVYSSKGDVTVGLPLWIGGIVDLQGKRVDVHESYEFEREELEEGVVIGDITTTSHQSPGKEQKKRQVNVVARAPNGSIRLEPVEWVEELNVTNQTVKESS